MNFYPATRLTGGSAGSLDKIDGDLLADGDAAFAVLRDDPVVGNALLAYVLDAASGETPVSPKVIAPGLNPGIKRWKLARLRSEMIIYSHANRFDVTDYGVDPFSGADQTAAIQAVIAMAEAAGYGCVYFPAGIYRHTGLFVRKSKIALRGDGFATQLVKIGGNANHSIHLEPLNPTVPANRMFYNSVTSMMLRAEDGNSTGAGIYQNATVCCLCRDLQINDFRGGMLLGDAWMPQCYAVQMYSGQYYGLTEDTYFFRFIYSNGGTADHPVAVYMDNLQLKINNELTSYDYSTGIRYGFDFLAADGVWITNVHTNVIWDAAICIHPTLANERVTSVAIANIYVDADNPYADTHDAIVIEDNTGTGSGVGWINIGNGQLRGGTGTQNKHGVVIKGGYGIQIHDLEISGYTEYGIRVQSGRVVQLNDNIVTDNLLGGIKVDNNVSEFMINDNMIGTSNFSNNSRTQPFGIHLGTGCTRYSVTGNLFGQYNTTPLIDNSNHATGNTSGNAGA